MKRILITLATLLALAAPASATAQFPEIIKIDAKEESLTAEPLGEYLNSPDKFKILRESTDLGTCTALWRGYIGHWEIKNSKLLLNKLEVGSCSKETRKVLPLDKLFPGKSQPVFADWYSGTLVMPRGKLVEYVHAGYASRYEKYLILEIKKGFVVKQYTVKDKDHPRS
jgi:hypothetical protein